MGKKRVNAQTDKENGVKGKNSDAFFVKHVISTTLGEKSLSKYNRFLPQGRRNDSSKALSTFSQRY
jgi:hypothetical protein